MRPPSSPRPRRAVSRRSSSRRANARNPCSASRRRYRRSAKQQIEQANLNTVEDIARFVPSLSYNATTPGRGTIYFRGVADDSSSFIADASAAIYLDEQPLTQSSLQPEIRLVDIERIEALPGPQGTLYGASSQSGTLRYITNKPDPGGFETNVSLEGSSVDDGEVGYDLSAVLNVPLSDNMAIRLVGFTAHEAGFIDNVLRHQPRRDIRQRGCRRRRHQRDRLFRRPCGVSLAAER